MNTKEEDIKSRVRYWSWDRTKGDVWIELPGVFGWKKTLWEISFELVFEGFSHFWSCYSALGLLQREALLYYYWVLCLDLQCTPKTPGSDLTRKGPLDARPIFGSNPTSKPGQTDPKSESKNTFLTQISCQFDPDSGSVWPRNGSGWMGPFPGQIWPGSFYWVYKLCFHYNTTTIDGNVMAERFCASNLCSDGWVVRMWVWILPVTIVLVSLSKILYHNYFSPPSRKWIPVRAEFVLVKTFLHFLVVYCTAARHFSQ